MGFNVHGPLATDLTRQMCHFIKELKYEDIPPAVIERAKMMIMQTVGVSICSSELKLVKDAIEISKEMSPGSEGTATLWADGAKVSWEAAMFTAGTMGDTLDWEDCSVTGHPSCGVIPAAIITAVELIQLFTLVGSCDVDDLILNVIGSAIGYGFHKAANKPAP